MALKWMQINGIYDFCRVTAKNSFPWRLALENEQNVMQEEQRACELFYVRWVSGLFMHGVEKDLEWLLMCQISTPTSSRSKERSSMLFVKNEHG